MCALVCVLLLVFVFVLFPLVAEAAELASWGQSVCPATRIVDVPKISPKCGFTVRAKDRKNHAGSIVLLC